MPPDAKPLFTPEQGEEIARKLNDVGASRPCARCGNPHFVVMDGFFVLPVQTSATTFNIGGPSLPLVATACSKCLNVSFYAALPLGLSWLQKSQNQEATTK